MPILIRRFRATTKPHVASPSLVYLLSCLFALLIGAVTGAAQTPDNTPGATQTSAPPPASVPAVVPLKDVPTPTPAATGADKQLDWTLRDAILAALQNNVDIDIERRNVRIAEFNIKAAEGVYDTFLSATPSFSSSTQPNIGRFSGVSSSVDSSTSKSFNVPLSLDQQVQFGGGHFQTSFNTQRLTSNS